MECNLSGGVIVRAEYVYFLTVMQYGMIELYVLLMAEVLAWVQGLEFALSQGQPSKFLEIHGLEVLNICTCS
jgi:hypothetical protein